MGWNDYWKKRKHKSKGLCHNYQSLDSLEIFKSESVSFCWIVDEHELNGEIKEDGFYVFVYDTFLNSCIGYWMSIKKVLYVIPYEKRQCNGSYYFFCPKCNRRMKKLYLKNTRFLCRRCLNLGYHSQTISSSVRKLYRKFYYDYGSINF